MRQAQEELERRLRRRINTLATQLGAPLAREVCVCVCVCVCVLKHGRLPRVELSASVDT